MEAVSASDKKSKQLYRTLWRWHFYAGVFAIPFVIILAITGSLYLFKPQLDAIHDAPYRNLALNGDRSTPEQQVAAAIAAVPNSKFVAYELPREQSDAVNILLNQHGEKIRAYVHPNNLQVLLVEQEEKRFLRIVHDIHGELLLGKTGSILVELAACWAIVLVLTGIYLWWPRNAKGIAGVLYPRLSFKGRLFWRDLHSVIGIWISFFVLFLLLSGLPWTLVWGSAFKEVRELTGTSAVQQDWVNAGRKNTADQHSHDHSAHEDHAEHQADMNGVNTKAASLNKIVAGAQNLQLAYPVLISPPSAKSPDWSAKSNAQNRPLRADAYFSATSGELTRQQHFSQRHMIDRAVGIGVAAHEGQLFGWLNQLLGLLTAMGLIALSISGFIMWRKRAPQSALGAPPAMPEAKIGMGFVIIIFAAAILLPVLGASLIVIFLLEKILFSRWTKARIWLGL
ncbi:membrane protein [Cellvibrio zantedeschiae]|uniref:Membrane protein n=1 Tax=Cellvibrio zantedeschiae TaxID=1237077 RepID=A0ABQ3B4C5_9GAMM|nr:PepSY domain-containing protein [Cellvibrio zantedeschiae]GGY77620.1 membrane protein [Cellvibrio zantedeschiae]